MWHWLHCGCFFLPHQTWVPHSKSWKIFGMKLPASCLPYFRVVDSCHRMSPHSMLHQRLTWISRGVCSSIVSTWPLTYPMRRWEILAYTKELTTEIGNTWAFTSWLPGSLSVEWWNRLLSFVKPLSCHTDGWLNTRSLKAATPSVSVSRSLLLLGRLEYWRHWMPVCCTPSP